MTSDMQPSNTKRLFGTDGIRGIANQYPMTPEVALEVGKAVARTFRQHEERPPVIVIGKDTRLSGYLFENALTAGLLSGGATVFLVGPLPTPAVAHITRSFKADAGIMITASHNPADHNGIKIFDKDGRKLPDGTETAIEAVVHEKLASCGQDDGVTGAAIGKAKRIDDARGRYIEFAKATIDNASLDGLTVVLDCANGAAYSTAPVILQELGATVIKRHTSPDGLNINEGCGALHPEQLSAAVKAAGADVGVALDGDADRLIMVDEHGTVVDGDHLLAILALDLQARSALKKNAVVGTQYTNKGFDEAMNAAGITVHRVENGDRFVLEKLYELDLNLGGEQSGHLILLDYATTGDGTIAALHILRIMKARGKPLSALAQCMTSWPQQTESRAVREKRPLAELPKVTATIAAVGEELGDEGRVLVRYSGTEQKVRIMVEAKDAGRVTAGIRRVADAFAEEGL